MSAPNVSDLAKQEWSQLRINGRVPKVTEMRAFIKKYNLIVNASVGGFRKRTGADMCADISKAVGESNSKHLFAQSSEQVEEKKKELEVKAVVTVAPVVPDEEGSSKRNEVISDEAVGDHIAQLAEGGDGRKVISYVNAFNLSSRLSKETLKRIAEDCRTAGKK